MTPLDNRPYLTRLYAAAIDQSSRKNSAPHLLRSYTSEEFVRFYRQSTKFHPITTYSITAVVEARATQFGKIMTKDIPLRGLDEFVLALEQRLAEENLQIAAKNEAILKKAKINTSVEN